MIFIIIKVVPLGRMDYKEALDIQEKLLAMRQLGNVEDVLLLVEHPLVLTLGRNSDLYNILLTTEELEENGVKIYEIGRGGDVTYHGPGQIVGYPIIDLSNYGKDIKHYVWRIEEVFINLLQEEYNIAAHREDEKHRGVWVGNNKITAIGIAVKRWVTMHGFAFNVNTQLEHFRWINPCGITDKGVTSLQELLGHHLDFEQLNQLVLKYFCKIFETQYEIMDLKTLLGSD